MLWTSNRSFDCSIKEKWKTILDKRYLLYKLETKLYHSYILTCLGKCYYEIGSFDDSL
jgi:hypothetical protein